MIQLISDGSAEGAEAGCACILRIPEGHGLPRYLKTMAFLGELDPAESELCGGILGLAVLCSLSLPSESPELRWYCDHEPSRLAVAGNLEAWKKRGWRTAQGAEIRHDQAWKLFDFLSKDFSLSVERPSSEVSSEHKACDRASRWARRGRLQHKTSSGLVGRLALREPDKAWWFIDASEIAEHLHSGSEPREILTLLLAKLSLREL